MILGPSGRFSGSRFMFTHPGPARVENLLDQKSEDVHTYGTTGRGFFVALRATH
jgi:hypothetical protein